MCLPWERNLWGNMHRSLAFSRHPQNAMFQVAPRRQTWENASKPENRAITGWQLLPEAEWMELSEDTTQPRLHVALRPWESQIFGGGQANKSAEWLVLCGPRTTCFYLHYLTTVSLIDAGSKKGRGLINSTEGTTVIYHSHRRARPSAVALTTPGDYLRHRWIT